MSCWFQYWATHFLLQVLVCDLKRGEEAPWSDMHWKQC